MLCFVPEGRYESIDFIFQINTKRMQATLKFIKLEKILITIFSYVY